MKRIVTIMAACAVFALSGCGAVSVRNPAEEQQEADSGRHGFVACTSRIEDKYAHMVAEAVYDAVNKENTDTLYGMFSEKAKEKASLLKDIEDNAEKIPVFDEYEGTASVCESHEYGTDTKSIQVLMDIKKDGEKRGRLNIVYVMENDEDRSIKGVHLIEYAEEGAWKKNGFVWREAGSEPGMFFES